VKQNLIPLFLRPLRLFVPAEQLRRTRIVLLKITHAPLVVAIWSFENVMDYFKRGRRNGVFSLGASASSMSLKTSFFRASRSYPQTLVPGSLNQATLVGAARASRFATNISHHPPVEVSNECRDHIESLVMKLCSQVEQLTALVAGQQMERKSSDQDAD